MRILFIGSVEFSARILEKLINRGEQIAGVAAPCRAGFNSDFAELSGIAARHGLPYLGLKDVNAPETLAWIKRAAPDVIFCFGLSRIIGAELLRVPPMGVVGYHPASLPQNRGRHPIIWALALGLERTGSTFFMMDEGVDTGRILSQKTVPIRYRDTARSLYDRLIRTALVQIKEFLPALASGNPPKTSAQPGAKANSWRKRSVLDGQIDFRMTSRWIYNLTRALSEPYVGAHVRYNGRDVKIWAVKEIKNVHRNIECGKVIRSDCRGILVKCAEGAVLLVRHEFEAIPKAGEYIL